MAEDKTHMEKRMTKNDASYHGRVKPQAPEPHIGYQHYTDVELRATLERLDIVHDHLSRDEMISKLREIRSAGGGAA